MNDSDKESLIVAEVARLVDENARLKKLADVCVARIVRLSGVDQATVQKQLASALGDSDEPTQGG